MLTAVDPPVRITVSGCAPEVPGRWLVTWRVTNRLGSPIHLDDAWIPHGRFRGDGHVPLQAEFLPGASVDLDLRVSALEAAGSVVENAFLILRGRVAGEAWRVFARMRVSFAADGSPRRWSRPLRPKRSKLGFAR